MICLQFVLNKKECKETFVWYCRYAYSVALSPCLNIEAKQDTAPAFFHNIPVTINGDIMATIIYGEKFVIMELSTIQDHTIAANLCLQNQYFYA